MSEPSGGFTVQVDGRTVIVRTGTKSQTVSICTPANVAGTYEVRYRLDPLNAVRTETDLADQPSLAALRDWLRARTGREEDPTGRPVPLPTVPVDASDPWLTHAVAVVDAAIDALVLEFLERRYRHRVEHSLHTELVTRLMTDEELAKTARLSDGVETQLVHKEWPETEVRGDRGKTVERRGLFDIVVLSPAQLGHATLDQFKAGRIAAPIVVELGLDYGARHLEGDLHKFANSAVSFGRLVHLARLPSGRPVVERIVNETASGTDSLRVAYGYHDGQHRAAKLLSESAVHDVS